MTSSVRPLIPLWIAAILAFAGPSAWGQFDYDREPIRYSSTKSNDPIARLQRQIDVGEIELEFDDQLGYLPSLLAKLDVSTDSQMLVFSKTSFQMRHISPRTPRALYFNDDTFVGYVQRGDVLELSAVDPQLGSVFYTLHQAEREKPRFIRDQGNCMTCHQTSRTENVPGHLVRSIYPSASGMPHYGAGTFTTRQSSPLRDRWGGWYVSGTHGKQRHMGNVVSNDRNRPENLNVEAGANAADLSELLDTDPYPTAHSDIVALMVLEHQIGTHNLITSATYSTRMALFQNTAMNEALERPEGHVSESTERRIDSAVDKLVAHMLFVDETPLTDPIRGTSGFAEEFAQRGPFDASGRSLRDFDLKTRLFKYPCSYLIYSDPFQQMPVEAKQRVYQRLFELLSGTDDDERFEHLTDADRRAILVILSDTLTDLPDSWSESLRSPS